MSIKGFQIGEGSVQKYDYTELDNKPTVPVVDATLTTTGAAADAKKTGDEIADLKSAINSKPNIVDTDSETDGIDIIDNDGYVVLRLSNGHIKTKEFDSSVRVGFEYKFSGSDLLISYGYNSTHDAVVVLNEGRANGLFDFSSLRLKPKGDSLFDYETNDLTIVWSSGTDMHAPFQFLAVNNADGYHSDATSPGFVGGNHTLDQLGTGFETASSKYVFYFADGRPVTGGYGKCNKFEVRWANDVQAYNTVKQGGGGRSCLTEYHDMIFDGVRFNEQIRLVPLEDIKMALWYGLQFVSFGTKYTNITFQDGATRQSFISSDSNIKSGNAVASGMLAWGATDAIELTVDINYDLGKRDGTYSNDKGAFVSSSKGYFTIINKSTNMVDMAEGSNWFLRGSFRFFPAIQDTEE